MLFFLLSTWAAGWPTAEDRALSGAPGAFQSPSLCHHPSGDISFVLSRSLYTLLLPWIISRTGWVGRVENRKTSSLRRGLSGLAGGFHLFLCGHHQRRASFIELVGYIPCLLVGWGHKLLFGNPRRVTHFPMGALHWLVCRDVTWLSCCGGNFTDKKGGCGKGKEDNCLGIHFFITHPGSKFVFLDPYGISFQIEISIKRVVCLLLYNLQSQVVLRWIELWVCRDINKPMHLNNLYLPRSSECYKWWDIAFIFFSAPDADCSYKTLNVDIILHESFVASRKKPSITMMSTNYCNKDSAVGTEKNQKTGD